MMLGAVESRTPFHTTILGDDYLTAKAEPRGGPLPHLAKIVLSYTNLLAPFDGVILVRQAELGEIAVPGTPIVTLADLDHLWLRAYVDQGLIGKLHDGQMAVVSTSSYPGKTFAGRISFISSETEFIPSRGEPNTQAGHIANRIRIDLQNSTHELLIGMPVEARIRLLSSATWDGPPGRVGKSTGH